MNYFNLQLFGGGGGSSGGSFRGSRSPNNTGLPNSKYTQYKNGKKFQERWYDDKGNRKTDKDYTDHSRPDKHPVVPHYHDWNNGQRGKGYWYDEQGIKHFFNKENKNV